MSSQFYKCSLYILAILKVNNPNIKHATIKATSAQMMFQEDSTLQNSAESHSVPTVSRQSILAELKTCFLILTQNVPNPSQLSQCHTLINQSMRDPCILEVLVELLEAWAESDETAAKLVITQISVYVKKQTSFGCERRHSREQINFLFLKLFMNPKLPFKFKHMTEASFMNFLFASHSNHFEINIDERSVEQTVKYIQSIVTGIYSTSERCVQEFSEYCNYTTPITLFLPPPNIITDNNARHLQGLGVIVKCLLQGGTLTIEHLKNTLDSCLSVYLRMCIESVKSIVRCISQKDEVGFFMRYLISQQIYSVKACAKFMDIFLLLYLRTDYSRVPTLKQRLLRTTEVSRLMLIILNLSPSFQSQEIVATIDEINSQKVISGDSFVKALPFEKLLVTMQQYSDGKNPFAQLNQVKQHALELLYNATKIIAKKKKDAVDKYKNLTTILGLTFEKLSSVLVREIEFYLLAYQNQATNYGTSFAVKQNQDLYAKCMKFLGEVVKVQSLYKIVEAKRGELIFKVCFPLLITRKQHERFEAEDYTFFKEDIINKQNLSYIENSVAKLIEDYLDFVDGSITVVLEAPMNLISFHLTANPQYYEALPHELRDSWVVKHYCMEQQLDGAMTLMSVESYLSDSRNDLVQSLERWMIRHKDYFLKVDNDYRVTTCFCLLYSYFCDNFYNNLICGQSPLENRLFHRQVLLFCCRCMMAQYSYEKNNYPNRYAKIMCLQAMNCLNNSFNHVEMFPALYYEFPAKSQIYIPHYFGIYSNYPHYPIVNENFNERNAIDESFGDQRKLEDGLLEKHKKTALERYRQESKGLLVHYRQLGLNQEQNIYKNDILEIVQFLCASFETQANIQILETLIECFTQYLKHEIENQGSVVNIPSVIRDEVATQVAIKLYSLFQSKPKKFPNLGLYEAKATELLYLTHCISSDAYSIYNMGMEVIWINPSFWQFKPTDEEANIDCLLKCTDLVVRLALKKYSSEKNVDITGMLEKIAENITQYSFEYVKKIHKYNRIFGILLNLILLQIHPQKIFMYLYEALSGYFMKASADQEKIFDPEEDEDQNLFEVPKVKTEDSLFPSSTLQVLTKHSFYLFMINLERNPHCLGTNENLKMLKQFGEYLRHFANKQGIVRQVGDVFGKVLTICITLMDKQLEKLPEISQSHVDSKLLQFLWKNALFSSQIYSRAIQKRIVAIKALSIFRKQIQDFFMGKSQESLSLDEQRLKQLYQLACSCVFYVRSPELMMDGSCDDGGDEDLDVDFEHEGEEELWEEKPITTQNNEAELYIGDEVMDLKNTTRKVMESGNQALKQWMANVIENMPVAIRNFLKNKVINYMQEAKEMPLRKIVKVKRPNLEQEGKGFKHRAGEREQTEN